MSLTLTAAELEALRVSAWVACGCCLVVVLPGIAFGWLLARKQFPGKALLDGLLHVPLVLPPVVTGYLLLLLLGRNGLFGHWLEAWFGLTLAFSWYAAVIASAVVALPLMVRSVRLAVAMIDPELEQAATTLGAGPWRRFLTITLPLALPGIVAGVLLAFARSLGEFGATVTFAGNLAGETRTLSLAVYSAMQSANAEAMVARLAGISVLLALTAMVASEVLARFARRRLAQG